MKFAVFVVALILAVLNAATATQPVCNTGAGTGLLNDCTKFMVCNDGFWMIFDCPSGQKYNFSSDVSIYYS